MTNDGFFHATKSQVGLVVILFFFFFPWAYLMVLSGYLKRLICGHARHLLYRGGVFMFQTS